MAWLIFPAALVLIMVAGVRVLRGRGVTPNRPRDEARVRRWVRAQKEGFILHCLQTAAPFAVSFYGLAPLIQSWRQTGVPAFPIERLPTLLVSALVTTLLVGAFSWAMTRAEAREAAERLRSANA